MLVNRGASLPHHAPMSRSTKGEYALAARAQSRLSILACLPMTAPVLPAVG
jgi:hypothetical protein